MADIAIVSTARTPIGKAYRVAINMTHGATHAGHLLIDGRKPKAKLAVFTMCIGVGMVAAGLVEILH